MKISEENDSLLIDKMKNICCFFGVLFLFSCTSNTILEKPKDLIPKDSMSILMEEMMIASSSKFIKNKFQENDVNYMALVYEKFKIDSVRFQNSNLYYMSKIDEYQKILETATNSLEAKKELFAKQKTRLDSIRKDSIKKIKTDSKLLDSVKKLELKPLQ
ncbi:DUF4296 domain-containing protein [Polaribacter sp. BAL334]|uniref:DUF4296 domain-containing protein n=1 Tax=Polaribacter sp. BAL334 TaxID=1708178 RepID=UPI001E65B6C9|nr:DUF4296 domain-containing protein [Polaribacter sp. BAL334]